MREAELPVKIEPHGKTVYVLPGTKVLEAAARAGLVFNAPCGGQGTCGKCRVRMARGGSEPSNAEKALLTEQELADGFRLGCQADVLGPTAIDVPDTSLMGSAYQILGAGPESVAEVAASVRKVYVELPAPTREDHAADIERLQRVLPPFRASLDVLRTAPRRLREWGFKGTAVLADHTLIALEEGDTTGECYGVAFDIGTTTLVGILLDLRTGVELASAARMNPQTRFGDDVLSRILHAREHRHGLDALHGAIIDAINEMLGELAGEAGIARASIYEIALAGNTTMQHLMLGLDPSALGEVPFVSATTRGLVLEACEAGLDLCSAGRAYVFPIIGGFVGGDTVAGMLAAGIENTGGAVLFVDIGTNGEIVVVHNGKMAAASTAAGPAFEGARIQHGMRAATGAIEKVVIADDLHLNVIGNAAPVGLCGSALIDIAAELLRHGLLMPQGLIVSPEDAGERVPDALRRRLIPGKHGTDFLLASAEESGTGEAIVLTQQDVRELQLATAAIRAGTAILLKRFGLAAGDLDRILVAGGFGNFIRRNNAQCIGLLPEAAPHHKILYAGNTSLTGARLALLSQKARQRAEAIARDVEHIDLSQDPEFQNAYVEGMFFPEVCPPAHDG